MTELRHADYDYGVVHSVPMITLNQLPTQEEWDVGVVARPEGFAATPDRRTR